MLLTRQHPVNGFRACGYRQPLKENGCIQIGEERKNDTWYFLNNNIGYCLNIEGRHQEAEKHCRAAIRINRKRRNAFKNLGIALEGKGRHVDAARNYLRAAKLCSTDPRAIVLLNRLIGSHREILEANTKLQAQMREWQQVMESLTERDTVH